jgi:hypothetical protein
MDKKLWVLTVVLFGVLLSAKAQSGDNSIKAGWGNLDYYVPQSPAFKILGTDPDNILKPTSVRKVALSIGDYFYNSGSVLPRDLSVELSPLLLNGKASLNDYNKNKFLYRMRLSIGTSVNSEGGYAIAEGLRFTIIDKTDLRTNTAFLKDITTTLGAAVDAEDKAIPAYIKENQLTMTEIQFREAMENDSTLYQKLLVFETRFIPDTIIQPESLAALRDKYRNILWNKPIWDVGIATLQSSKDSLIKNLAFSQIGFWTTAGVPIGKNGQLLIGGKLGIVESTKWQTTASIGSRYYYGSNNIKGFIYGEYGYSDKVNSGVAGAGCQFNITNGLWGQFSINLVIANGNVTYQPAINIGLGTPEKNK